MTLSSAAGGQELPAECWSQHISLSKEKDEAGGDDPCPPAESLPPSSPLHRSCKHLYLFINHQTILTVFLAFGIYFVCCCLYVVECVKYY